MDKILRGKKLVNAILKLCPFKIGDRVETIKEHETEFGNYFKGKVTQIDFIINDIEPFIIHVKTSEGMQELNSAWLRKVKCSKR